MLVFLNFTGQYSEFSGQRRTLSQNQEPFCSICLFLFFHFRFRLSATKSRRPYGVMCASLLSLSSCRTPGGQPCGGSALWGGQRCGGVSLWVGVSLGSHVTASHDCVMDGRGRSAFTLTKRTCLQNCTEPAILISFHLGVEQLQKWTAESHTDVSFGEMSPDWLRRAKEHLETNVTHMYTDLVLKDRKGGRDKKLKDIIQLFDEVHLPQSRDPELPRSGPVRIGVLGKITDLLVPPET